MKLEKKALLLVNGVGKYDNTVPIFEKYELLDHINVYVYGAQIFLSLYEHHREIISEVFFHFF